MTNDQGEGLLDTDSAREILRKSEKSRPGKSSKNYQLDNNRNSLSNPHLSPQNQGSQPVAEITGGCFCCRLEELVGAIEELSWESRPEVIVAEPVGSCTDLMATVVRPLEQVYETPLALAPLSVVLDARRALAALGGRRNKRDFHRDVGYIYRKQLEEAEWLVVNKCDLLSADDLADLQARLDRDYPGKRVFLLSAKTGEGLEEWFAALLQHETAGGQEVEVDYERYAEGEALLGWVKSEARCQPREEVDWGQWLAQVARTIATRLEEAGHEVGHFKMSVEANGRRYRVHQVMSGEEVVSENTSDPRAGRLSSTGETPVLPAEQLRPTGGTSVLPAKQEATLLVNLRAEGEAKALKAIVTQTFDAQSEVEVLFQKQAAFQPGKPVPVHRIAIA
ncbi:GTP-binding protein [Roseibacillus ishigakijimensis]